MNEIYTNIEDTCPINVYYQDEISLDVDGQMMYIRSGEEEIQSFVETVLKPDIKTFTESTCTSFVDQSKLQATISAEQADLATIRAGEALQSAVTASDKAEHAAVSERQAAQSATEASESASTAASEATKAANSATSAASSASTAGTKASESSTNAHLAQTAKSGAELAQQHAEEALALARRYANADENEVVEVIL